MIEQQAFAPPGPYSALTGAAGNDLNIPLQYGLNADPTLAGLSDPLQASEEQHGGAAPGGIVYDNFDPTGGFHNNTMVQRPTSFTTAGESGGGIGPAAAPTGLPARAPGTLAAPVAPVGISAAAAPAPTAAAPINYNANIAAIHAHTNQWRAQQQPPAGAGVRLP